MARPAGKKQAEDVGAGLDRAFDRALEMWLDGNRTDRVEAEGYVLALIRRRSLSYWSVTFPDMIEYHDVIDELTGELLSEAPTQERPCRFYTDWIELEPERAVFGWHRLRLPRWVYEQREAFRYDRLDDDRRERQREEKLRDEAEQRRNQTDTEFYATVDPEVIGNAKGESASAKVRAQRARQRRDDARQGDLF